LAWFVGDAVAVIATLAENGVRDDRRPATSARVAKMLAYDLRQELQGPVGRCLQMAESCHPSFS